MNSPALLRKISGNTVVAAILACALTGSAFAQRTGPTSITLDEAIQMALQHNHNLLAARTTIQQSEADEKTANLRPNPSLFADWEYLPLGSPAHQNPSVYGGQSLGDYLHNNTEADVGLSYLIERGKKRQHRLQAAKDLTAQTRSLVTDNERTLTFQCRLAVCECAACPVDDRTCARRISRAFRRPWSLANCATPKAQSARTIS